MGKGQRIDLNRYRAPQKKRKERLKRTMKLVNHWSGKGKLEELAEHTELQSKRVAILVFPKSFCPFLSLANSSQSLSRSHTLFYQSIKTVARTRSMPIQNGSSAGGYKLLRVLVSEGCIGPNLEEHLYLVQEGYLTCYDHGPQQPKRQPRRHDSFESSRQALG